MEAAEQVKQGDIATPTAIGALWNKAQDAEEALVEAAKVLVARRLLQEQSCEACIDESMDAYISAVHSVMDAANSWEDALVALGEAFHAEEAAKATTI